MASIGTYGKRGDLTRIGFRDNDGKQKTLRLGRCSKRSAQTALVGFEHVLETHRLGTAIHPDGARWLAGLDERIHDRVVALGLATTRPVAEVATLGQLLARFEATATVKASTMATSFSTSG